MTERGTDLERLIGLEVLDMARRSGMRHNELQAASGIEPRSFRRYFVESSRHIPVEELRKVASALGVPASQIVAQAEAKAATESRDAD
jgi:hypothetical protein